jgi:hypothetical protein
VVKQSRSIDRKPSVLILWPFDSSLQAQKNFGYVVGFFTLTVAIYTAFSRHTLKEFLTVTAPIAATLTMIVLGSSIYLDMAENARWPQAKRSRWSRAKGHTLVTVVSVPILSVGFYVLGVSLYDLFRWARSFVIVASYGPARIRILVALSSLGIGAICYAVRSRYRTCYGITEIIIGVLVALSKTSENSTNFNQLEVTQVSSTFALAVLTASVYLIVRGFDNLAQGLEKDPVVAASIRWLRRHNYLRSEPSASP